MNCNVRATVTHILSAIRFKVYGLNYHDTLDIRRSEEVSWVSEDSPEDIDQTASHLFLVDQTSQKRGKFSSSYTFGFCIGR